MFHHRVKILIQGARSCYDGEYLCHLLFIQVDFQGESVINQIKIRTSLCLMEFLIAQTSKLDMQVFVGRIKCI